MNDIIRLLTQRRVSLSNPLTRSWVSAVLQEPTLWIADAQRYFPLSPLNQLERYYVRQIVDSLGASEDVYTLLIHLPLEISNELARNYLRNLIPSGALTYAEKVIAVAPDNLIGYWRLNESSGSTALDSSGNGRNGTYSGATLGATGIGDGGTAASFAGAGNVTLYSAGLDSAFNRDEGTLLAWSQITSAGVWSDGLTRHIFRIGSTNNTSNMTLFLRKTTAANTLEAFRGANSVSKNWTFNHNSLEWMCLVLTWSVANDRQKIFFNGAQNGATLTGLGSGVGDAIASVANIGAGSSGQNWFGSLAHVALWKTELSDAQSSSLAQI